MKIITSALLGVVSACAANAQAPKERSEMPGDADTVRRFAAIEKTWKEDETSVARFSGITLEPCHFYTVTHEKQPIQEAPTYALLPSGEVVSQADERAVGRILAACDTSGASAASWAELLA